MSARALVSILQRFEHVKYLRYLMGQLGAALVEMSFLGHCRLSVTINKIDITERLPKRRAAVRSLWYLPLLLSIPLILARSYVGANA